MEFGGGTGATFEVSPDPETAATNAQFEGANVCRVAALSTMLGGDRAAMSAVAAPLDELGVSERLYARDAAPSDIAPGESFSDVGR